MKLKTFPDPSLPAPFLVITFEGQLMIRPAAGGQSCKVSVNYNTHVPHELRLIFKAIKANAAETIASLSGKLEDTFSIEVTPATQGVFGFIPTPGPIFNRSSNNDRQDLRWAIDLQNSREFHNFDLKVDDANVEPGLLMKDGVFYTFDKSSPVTLFVNRNRPGDVLPLPSIGTIIGAIIGPPPNGSSILVKWKEGGIAKSKNLSSGGGDDTHYSITVQNEPLSTPGGTVHDELEEYYRVLKKMNGSAIPSFEQFKLEMVDLTSHDGDRLPCMSVFLGE